MLEVVRPTQIDGDRTAAKFDKHGVEVELVHARHEDWTIWATVGDRDAIVSAGGAHEHFFAPSSEAEEERPWTTEIVDFMAEMLRGEIEVETTLRGTRALAVRHFNRDESGERRLLGHTAFLTPARLLVWRPQRRETERRSFL